MDSANEPGDQELGASARADLIAAAVKVLPASIKYIENKNKGKVEGCGIEYVVAGQDIADAQGGLIILNGSLTLIFTGDQMFYAFKVIPSDVELNSDGTMKQREPFDISHAYLSTPSGDVHPAQETISECELGGLCAAFHTADQFNAIAKMLAAMDFSIAYTRTGSRRDVFVPINPDRVENHESIMTQTMSCLALLAESLPD